MKKTMFVILFMIIAGFIFSAPAIAEVNAINLILNVDEQFSGNNSDLVQQKINDLNNDLNLTEDQKQKADDLGIESAKKLNIYKVGAVEEKKKLIFMKRTHNPQSEIAAQILVLKTLDLKMNATREQNIQNFQEILTADQQAIFEKFMNDLKQISDNDKASDVTSDRRPRYDALENIEN